MSTNDSHIWDAYNTLMLSSDVDRLRKVLARSELLSLALNVPGDIFECGVYRGVGVFTYLKLLKILGHDRMVVGFETFGKFAEQETYPEQVLAAKLVSWWGPEEMDHIDVAELQAKASEFGRVRLVDGDIKETAPKYAKDHPEQRIALLYLDMDFKAPTEVALEHFWPMVSPGGVVVFDEYGVEGFTETIAVDNFVKKHNLPLRTIRWAKSPTAFLVK